MDQNLREEINKLAKRHIKFGFTCVSISVIMMVVLAVAFVFFALASLASLGPACNAGGSEEGILILFIFLFGLLLITLFVIAPLVFLSGNYIKKLKNRRFSFFVSRVLASFPFGIALGNDALSFLNRPEVKELYQKKQN